MGNSTAQCASAFDPSCKGGELPAQCEPCVQAVEDAVLIDPGLLWDSSEADSDCPHQPSSGSSQRKLASKPVSGCGINGRTYARHAPMKSYAVGPPRIAAAPPAPTEIHKAREAAQLIPSSPPHAANTAQGCGADASKSDEAHSEFMINRYSTSQYLPTPQALERLGDPDEEEEHPIPKGKPVELSRDAARLQRGAEQTTDEREANNEQSLAIMSVPSDHMPLPQDHLRQQSPVSMPRTVTPTSEQLESEVWEVYTRATQRAAQVASLRGAVKQASQAWNPASQPGALACYGSTMIARHSFGRITPSQAVEHAPTTLPSPVPLPSVYSTYKASARFAPSAFAIRV
mmetsp:Transcript_42892/g.68518  ORF Transcript_42892/g.68518 Transcript_42892/m.68518 type:complete len:345 (+) Transcript_42892:50-1084(+)